MIYKPKLAAPDATLQNENGPVGTVPSPTVSPSGNVQLTPPKLNPPPITLNPDSPGAITPPSSAPASPTYVPPSSAMTPYTGGMMNSSTIAPPSGVSDGAGWETGLTLPNGPQTLPPAPLLPPGAAPITGEETPYSIGTGPSAGTSGLLDQMTQLMQGRLSSPGGAPITGTRSTGALDSRLESEAFRQLDQPTVYDDPLAKSAAEMMKRGIGENYAGAQESLNAELADRGINFSSIAGGRNVDLATRKAQALSDVDTNIFRERAQALAAGRTAAFSNARGIRGDQYQSDRDVVGDQRYERGYADDRSSQLFSDARGLLGDRSSIESGTRANQVGERGYVDSLSQRARDEALQTAQLDDSAGYRNDQAMQDFLSRIYGYGSDTSGAGLLGNAAGNYGDAAGQYGDQAGGEEDMLAQLAQYAAQFLGGGNRRAA